VRGGHHLTRWHTPDLVRHPGAFVFRLASELVGVKVFCHTQNVRGVAEMLTWCGYTDGPHHDSDVGAALPHVPHAEVDRLDDSQPDESGGYPRVVVRSCCPHSEGYVEQAEHAQRERRFFTFTHTGLISVVWARPIVAQPQAVRVMPKA